MAVATCACHRAHHSGMKTWRQQTVPAAAAPEPMAAHSIALTASAAQLSSRLHVWSTTNVRRRVDRMLLYWITRPGDARGPGGGPICRSTIFAWPCRSRLREQNCVCDRAACTMHACLQRTRHATAPRRTHTHASWQPHARRAPHPLGDDRCKQRQLHRMQRPLRRKHGPPGGLQAVVRLHHDCRCSGAADCLARAACVAGRAADVRRQGRQFERSTLEAPPVNIAACCTRPGAAAARAAGQTPAHLHHHKRQE